MRVLTVSLVSLALFAPSACKWEASWQVGPDAPPMPSQSAPALDVPTVTQARIQTASGAPATEFAADTSEFICAWEVEGVAAGTEIVGAWVAVDTGGVAPPNYKIDEAKLMLNGPTEGTFSLTKSAKNWPAGRYQVEIFLAGTLVKTVPFVVG
jgi:hypothetical protein